MGYDRIRIKSNEHGGWLERGQADSLNLSEEFAIAFNRLYTQGHFVVLEAGTNYVFDELFLFESGADAQKFYEADFKEWESFIGNNDEGCGFQGVSLYSDGLMLATKSHAPSKRIEVAHG